MKTRLLIVGLLLLTSACGFHLRGSQPTKLNIDGVYINVASAARLGAKIKAKLAGAGIAMTTSATNAKYILVLKQEHFERSVLSVSATTGKVEEYQILYTVLMDVHHSGKVIVTDDKISLVRDFIFDGSEVLGKFSEEELLQTEIIEHAADRVVRRLQALITK